VTCEAQFERYTHGGGIAIQLVDPGDDCPVATATVNPTTRVPEGHVAVKDWSENEGILAALVAARIVRDTGMRIPCGYSSAALCRLLVTPVDAA
jgi:hypothetical protein